MNAEPASDRAAFRATQVAAIPGWYSPLGHLGFPSLVGLAVIAAAVWVIDGLRAWELLAVPIVYVACNATEWRAHRDLLHRRFPPLQELYDRHTPVHHRIFVTDDMAIHSRLEYRLVLIPFYGILAVLAAIAPIGGALWLLGQHNVAALFVATTTGFVVSYEWLHLAYHLPEDSFIGRLGVVRALRHHHAVHHAPSLMQEWNFNVTVPLWDLVRGTVWRGPPPG